MLDMFSGWLTFSAAGATGIPLWLVFLIVVAIFVVPFALGGFVAQVLKLKDLGFKMGVILLTAVLGVTPFVWQVVEGKLEMQQWEVRHAEWQVKQNLISDEAVAKLQKELKDCEIER
jgi:hypothetical protein